MTQENRFPEGWDEARVRRLIERYESQTEDEAVAEDGAGREDDDPVLVAVPRELVSEVRDLISRHRAG
jgi:hypothetical protein